MPSDNSIETFAVSGTRAESDFALLMLHFDASEPLIVALQFSNDSVLLNQGERLLARFGQLPGMHRNLTLAQLFPKSIPDSYPVPPLPFHLVENHLYVGYFQPESQDREAIMASVFELAEQIRTEQGSQLVRLVLAGEPVVNYQLNLSSLEVKLRFFPILILLSLVFLGLFFRDWKVLLVAGLATIGALASVLGLMAVLGESLNLVTALIPALVFVLSMAMQVHLLIAMAEQGDIMGGIRAKLSANFLVSLTTSIGFGSLMTSQVVPIAVMGRYMAVSVWLVFLWAHGVHFGISRLVNLKPRAPAMQGMMRLLRNTRYLSLVGQPRIWFAPLLVILVGIWLLRTNPTESNGLRYFQEQDPLRQQTAFLEDHITGSSQIEVILCRGSTGKVQETWFPDEVSRLEDQLADLIEVHHVLSLNRFASFASACEARGLSPDLGESLFAPYLSADFYRIQLLVDSTDLPSYLSLRRSIEAIVALQMPGTKFHITGVLDRILEIQSYLLSSLTRSLALTVAAVVVLLLLVMGRQAHLSALIIPNLFPLGVMAVMMQLCSIKTTLSSVMVFSVAFGIAVDDTIHLLTTYIHSRGCNHEQRWYQTVSLDARAISLTTLVLTMGFAVLTTSSFLPTRDFGLLLSVGMVAALLGDLLFLPGMLKLSYKK